MNKERLVEFKTWYTPTGASRGPDGPGESRSCRPCQAKTSWFKSGDRQTDLHFPFPSFYFNTRLRLRLYETYKYCPPFDTCFWISGQCFARISLIFKLTSGEGQCSRHLRVFKPIMAMRLLLLITRVTRLESSSEIT